MSVYVGDILESDLESLEPLVAPRTTRVQTPNPLPKLQLAAVFAVKIIIPTVSTQVLPYINVMCEQLAASEGAKTGYYSGALSSASSISHLISIYFWASVSDRVGRLPVIIVGMLGVSLFSLAFGLSRTFTNVLITRFLVGLFSGTTGAIHSIVGELTDETNQSIAFPLYDICSAVGYVIGPLIGGTFAEPAKAFPKWFDTPFWRTYPFFLPSLVAATLAVVSLSVALFIIEETLAIKRKNPDDEPIVVTTPPIYGSTTPDSDSNHEPDDSAPLSAKALLSIPVFRAVFFSSGALTFSAGCFNTVLVLMAYAPVQQGGLAMSPNQIGTALAVMGTISIFMKLAMPFFLRRFGTLNMFNFCMQIWPVTFAFMPVLSLLAKAATSFVSRSVGALEWSAMAVVLALSRIGCLAFSIVMILTKDHAPGSSSLGTANGLAEFAQSLTAVFAPTIVSSTFAFSATHNILGGYAWVVFMMIFTALGSIFASRIRRYRHGRD